MVRLFVISIIIGFGFATRADQPPDFRDFVVTNEFRGKPAPVDLSSSRALEFKTELKRQATEGPDFAGHFKIAIWGCGSSCAAFAIVDSQTGQVYFPPELSYVTWTGYEGTNFGLQYRIDSRLLILNGSPEEKPQIGTFYYVWQTNTLRLIRTDLQRSTP